MNALSLYFTQPFSTEVREEPRPVPTAGQVLVAVQMSAISAGTEMLVFKGLFPRHMAVDATLAALGGRFEYPLRYGYSCVGRVIAAGHQVDPVWIGRQVFAFHPHASHFSAAPHELMPLPEGVAQEDALFLAGMETAVNLVMDGRPMIGERVVVWGQGVIGLLTIALLARYPLAALVAVDPVPFKRRTALLLGAHTAVSDMETDRDVGLQSTVPASLDDGTADLVFECSGNPQALNSALGSVGRETRIIVGSWYGVQPVKVDLGGKFHRERIAMTSSQVSTIAAALTGRWSKARRMQTAWQMVQAVRPARLITHRFAIQQAQDAYERIAGDDPEMLQAVFTYPPP